MKKYDNESISIRPIEDIHAEFEKPFNGRNIEMYETPPYRYKDAMMQERWHSYINGYKACLEFIQRNKNEAV